MDKKPMSLDFGMQMTGFEKIENTAFSKATAYVLALGKNSNRSYFSKEEVDKAYNTIGYIPVVGHLMETEDGKHYLGGHDYKFDIESLSLKSLCTPFGVVLPEAEPHYESVVEANNEIKTYLTVPVILWTGRYPELTEAIYDKKVMFGQSMEIFFSDSRPLEEDSNYTEILNFTFDALCMLNKSDDQKFNVEPCFPSAAIVKAEFSNNEQFNLSFEQMKEELAACFELLKEGGDESLNTEENKVVDEKFEAEAVENVGVDNAQFSEDESVNNETDTVETANFSATYNQKRDALRVLLEAKHDIKRDYEGNFVEETSYYLMDLSDEHAYIEKDHWSADGAYNCTHWRVPYSYDAVNHAAEFTGDAEEITLEWLTAEEKQKLELQTIQFQQTIQEMKSEFEEYKNEHQADNAEVDALREYKQNREDEIRTEQENEIFAKYEDVIGEMEEFGELKENARQFSIEDLENKMIFLYGKFSLANKTNAKPEKLEFSKVSVDETSVEDIINEPYGGVMKKYLKR